MSPGITSVDGLENWQLTVANRQPLRISESVRTSLQDKPKRGSNCVSSLSGAENLKTNRSKTPIRGAITALRLPLTHLVSRRIYWEHRVYLIHWASHDLVLHVQIMRAAACELRLVTLIHDQYFTPHRARAM